MLDYDTDPRIRATESATSKALKLNVIKHQALSESEARQLSQTGIIFHSIFRHRLDEAAAKKLIGHMVSGQEVEARQMIASNPRLLLIETDATDHLDRPIKKTFPLQAALRAVDIEMVKMTIEFFTRLPITVYGKTFQEQVEAVPLPGDCNEYDFTIVKAIKEASPADLTAVLSKTSHDSNLSRTLTAFEEEFKQRILAEPIASLQHLLKAIAIFDKYCTNNICTKWNEDQLNIFFRRVIGFAERLLAPCDKQALAQGLYFIVENHETLKRSLDFREGGGHFGDAGLGLDWACGGRGMKEQNPVTNPNIGLASGAHSSGVWWSVQEGLTKLISSKHSVIEQLRGPTVLMQNLAESMEELAGLTQELATFEEELKKSLTKNDETAIKIKTDITGTENDIAEVESTIMETKRQLQEELTQTKQASHSACAMRSPVL